MSGLFAYMQPDFSTLRSPGALSIAAHSLCIAAAVTGVEASSLMRPGRHQGTAAQARHLAGYLAHVGFGLPLRQVARELGCHVSSIAYGVRRIEEAREVPAFDALLSEVETRLRFLCDGRLP